MTTVLAVDPGKTTGVCIASCNSSELWINESYVLSWYNRHNIIDTIDCLFPPDIIVIEQFRLRADKAHTQVNSTFPSVQFIGIIDAAVYIYNTDSTIIYQQPAVMARVQIMPEHKDLLHNSEHARDAYKHLRYYWVTNIRGK